MELDSHTIFEQYFSLKPSFEFYYHCLVKLSSKRENKNKTLKKIINNSNNIQSREERNIREEVMFLEILTKGANTKSDKSKSFKYWKL